MEPALGFAIIMSIYIAVEGCKWLYDETEDLVFRLKRYLDRKIIESGKLQPRNIPPYTSQDITKPNRAIHRQ